MFICNASVLTFVLVEHLIHDVQRLRMHGRQHAQERSELIECPHVEVDAVAVGQPGPGHAVSIDVIQGRVG